MAKSIFDPKNTDEPLRGGLDRFLGPPAQDYSNMPEAAVNGVADVDEEAEAAVDTICSGQGVDKPAVCEIKEALDERLHTQPAKPVVKPIDGPA